jgi:dTDP-4-dehydrorhamnose 3,5-epimerase
MRAEITSIPGVLLLTPRVFEDPRGYFEETFQQESYAAAGVTCRFVQDNHSRSTRGVLRGLHYQVRKPQAKLLDVVRGTILDVVVDLRQGSPTFGRHEALELSDTNHRQIFIPAGFAHGFLVLSDHADVVYKCSDFFDMSDEAGVRWDDPTLGIGWPCATPLVSPKDAALPRLADIPREKLPQKKAEG